MDDCGVVVDEPLGEAERPEHVGVCVHGRRLGERAPQEIDGDLTGPAGQGAVGGAAQRVHDERVARRLSLLEMRGDLLRLGARRRQHGGGATVPHEPLRRRQLVVDGGAHHRVCELERQAVLEDVSPCERLGGVRRVVEILAGERRGVLELGVPAEDGDSPREIRRLRRDARQAEHHRTADRLRAYGRHPCGVPVERLDAFGAQGLEQRLEEERVPSGRGVARRHEGRLRLDAEDLLRENACRFLPQGRRAEHCSRRIADDREQQLRVAAHARRPGGDEHEQRQALEPPLEMREPAKRGHVRPVQVVDGEERGPAERQVRRDPVEGVEHRDRDASLVVVRVGELADIEELRSRGGRAVEQIGPL